MFVLYIFRYIFFINFFEFSFDAMELRIFLVFMDKDF